MPAPAVQPTPPMAPRELPARRPELKETTNAQALKDAGELVVLMSASPYRFAMEIVALRQQVERMANHIQLLLTKTDLEDEVRQLQADVRRLSFHSV